MPYVIEAGAEALRKNGYRCIVIGGGSEKEALEKEVKAKKLDDILSIMGEKPNALIQKYYQIAEIFINPTFTEGFPRVLIEAMASGLPIVTTDAGGIKDILGAKQREYMVDVRDRDGFAEKLRQLMADSGARDALKEENLHRVKRYSTENVAKMYIQKIFHG